MEPNQRPLKRSRRDEGNMMIHHIPMDKQQMPMQVQHDMTNLHQDDIWQRVQRLEQELRDREGKILLLQDELAKTKDQNEELEKRVKELTSKGSNKKGAQSRYWRKDEHERFLEAIQKFGKKDVKNIAGYVATRSATQVRTHAQKWFLKQVSLLFMIRLNGQIGEFLI